MKTIEKTVYKFDELSESAKNIAIDKLYDINVDYEWFDYVIQDAKEIGSIIGIDIDKIFFSGFYSQGDGACFEGSYSYAKMAHKKIREHAPKDKKLHLIADCLFDVQKENFYSLFATVKHSGHYSHEMCTDIEVYKEGYSYDLDWYSEGNLSETKEEIKEYLRDFMRWIYRRLEDEYDYLTSEEAIIETIEANDYEFNEDGSIF